MSIGRSAGRSSWFGLGRSRMSRLTGARDSQAPLALDAVPGGVDPRDLLAGAFDELLRHAARGQAVGVVLAHQLLPRGAQLLVGGGTGDAEHAIGVGLVGGGLARQGAACPVPRDLVEAE